MTTTSTKVNQMESRLATVCDRIRWLDAIVMLTMMVASMAIVLPVACLADKTSVLWHEENGNNGNSVKSYGSETERLLGIGLGEEATEGSSDSTSECTDDPEFRYGNKDCAWVAETRTRRRCKITLKKKPLAERCKRTCNYENCRKPTFDINDNTIFDMDKLTVGVYYYPWYAGDFHRGNPKNPDLYIRRQLIEPQQFPKLGEYDDRTLRVISQHLRWSRKNNIALWVTSWWGKDRREDTTIKNSILAHKQIRDLRIAIFYETTGRIREKFDYSLENVKSDLDYLCREYFHHKNYLRMGVDEDGNADATSRNTRPVLYVYLTRKLEQLNLLPEVIALMREGAREAGCGEIFIVGDQVFGRPPKDQDDILPFELLDAVTNYDVYGSMRGEENLGYIGSREKVTEYYQEQNQWRAVAHSLNCSFIPGVSPGYNDRGVRPEVDRIPLSRRLNQYAPEGSLFDAALQEARTIVDPAVGNLLMVNSMNEWHEDTQIEPCHAIDDDGDGDGELGEKINDTKSRPTTNLPTKLTYGLEYEAYGNLYLQILKTETEAWHTSMLITVPATPFVLPSAFEGIEGEKDQDQSIDIVTISDIIGWELDSEEGITEPPIENGGSKFFLPIGKKPENDESKL